MTWLDVSVVKDAEHVEEEEADNEAAATAGRSSI